MKSWTCIEKCGACCKFDLKNRANIYKVLDKKDIELIKSMTDKQGWCKYFDKKNYKCSVYENRPNFCRVDVFSKKFKRYFKQGDKFLIDCCKEHITSIYGNRSQQMRTFKIETNK